MDDGDGIGNGGEQPMLNGQSITKYSLLQFAMQHFRNE